MSLASSAFAALALILLLFAVAAIVEARGDLFSRRPALRHHAYTLALGVYCSSWTFYGAVGSAVRSGWAYVPIYLGPALLLLLAPGFLSRLSAAVREERAATVSDFIAARFGHDAGVARMVTLIALLGSIPYLALQLRSIGNALTIVSGRDIMVPSMVAASGLLTLFALLFGTRRFELAGRSEGLLYAIGLDSVIKIVALFAVAALALVLLSGAEAAPFAKAVETLGERFAPTHLTFEIALITLVSTFAIIALPRQFYMGLVEARDERDLVRARFGLAAYLLGMAVLIVPIALAGAALLPQDIDADLYVLQLPASAGSELILAAALLGGIGAASSMAIVDTTALATMVSNDLFAGAVIGSGKDRKAGAIGARMLGMRRISVAGVMLLALAFALLISRGQSLASMGLTAFAAMALFSPHLIIAALGKGRDPVAARASLGIGLALWAYTLALPPILPVPWLDALAGSFMDPHRLFGIGRASPFVHGVVWSLGVDLAVYALVAARKIPAPDLPRIFATPGRVSNVGELTHFVASFVGEERAQREFSESDPHDQVTPKNARKAQDLIARVVGASSARALVASALASGRMDLSDVTRLLDEGGQSLRFSRQLLAATFENVDAGISVVDGELNLIAWNSGYEDIFNYPAGMVRVGAPIEELIRHNATRGHFGEGDVDAVVERRLEPLREGRAHSFERRSSDGRVIKTVGGPMPGGGYVMSFTDVTEEARIRDELEQTLEQLEERVEARTRELSEANRLLARATRDKTRFLAAASHDLLQPLHAARLFTAALGRSVPDKEKPLVGRVDGAIVAAEELLRALLDISRLDAGGVTPETEPVALGPFLDDLVASFQPSAEAKGLSLRTGPLFGHIETDPGLLRSVMQNFLSNALRYTERGGVLVGVRKRGDMLRIDVIDSGVGFEPEQSEAIFREFTRLGTTEAEGLGLGLALVERIVRLLGGRIEVDARPGHGSRFSLMLPAREADDQPAQARVDPAPAPAPGHGLTVLVVDNDSRIVEATVELVESLGHRAIGVRDTAGALAHVDEIDAVLADYRLDNGEDGLSLIVRLRALRKGLPAAIFTAEVGGSFRSKAEASGVPVHAKPVAPEVIEAFLARAAIMSVGSVLQMQSERTRH
ncbi:PAS domain-containing hybrid sensor histidine kinase/response regulator [Novosphingobium sp. KN65.2]|uniref:hybrid sensor histidine kinase/response regulator n=1 Tax=Novosphingobium sp. KN65.2 TaxID=1478134 RepID=UPI0005DB0D23|nr:PAS domain-containing hybrid sensor histidine kinase/response regulator [Novosphingobium sp. KN65.2]CDO38854.1 Sensor protein [Novosphingobium sp. KN65.2]